MLRIEDTDRSRSTTNNTKAIIDELTWLGIHWDAGPVFQGDNVGRHREAATRLLAEGRAYRDFASPASLREEAARRGCHPSRIARERAMELTKGESDRKASRGDPYAIRFLVPDGETVVDDLVRGPVRFGHRDVDDLVILRSNGTPTYNLAATVDDAEAGITHVVRGEDHLSNTPKQALLYRALRLPAPSFAHVPLILGTDGSRLSKRHGARSVEEYADDGILPEALFNFLALLGWNPGDGREVMSRPELVRAFTLERVGAKGAVFDEEKLHWLNGRHLARKPTEELLGLVRSKLPPTASASEERRLRSAIDLYKTRSRTVARLAEQIVPVVGEEVVYQEKAVKKHLSKDPAAALYRLEALAGLVYVCPWDADELDAGIRRLAVAEGVGPGKYFHLLRVAMVGKLASADILQILLTVGRKRTIDRLRAARDMAKSGAGARPLGP